MALPGMYNPAEHIMHETFEKKVRAAAVAGWWTILIAVGFATVQWLVYLEVMATRPWWVHDLWGPEASWAFIQVVWFWAIVAIKFLIWLMVLAATWLSLWARRLRKTDRHLP
jgi:hypothetical protein